MLYRLRMYLLAVVWIGLGCALLWLSSRVLLEEPGWWRFEQRAGRYQVLFPRGKEISRVQDVETALGNLTLTFDGVIPTTDSKGYYMIGYSDLPPGPDYRDAETAHLFLDGAVRGTTDNPDFEKDSLTRITMGDWHGQELRGSRKKSGAKLHLKVFLVQNRPYFVFAEWSPKSRAANIADDDAKYFDSFVPELQSDGKKSPGAP